nr:MAG TPA: hypothetical protein [Caudoviricetes sp.]
MHLTNYKPSVRISISAFPFNTAIFQYRSPYKVASILPCTLTAI